MFTVTKTKGILRILMYLEKVQVRCAEVVTKRPYVLMHSEKVRCIDVPTNHKRN